jgi:hypothetical protein
MISGAFRRSAACILLLAALAQADTTYSETRSIPRESSGSSGGGSRGGSSSSGDDDEDEGWHSYSDVSSTRSGSEGPCSDIEMKDAGFAAIIGIPFAYGTCFAFVGLFRSLGHLASGDAEMSGLRAGSWRVGLGFDLGGMWLTEGAGGATLVPHLEVLRALSPGHQVSLRAGFAMALEGTTRDYARTAFTEGRRLGEEIDRIAYYDHQAMPVLLEYHRTSSAGLSLTVGVGAAAIRERIDFNRTWTYRIGERNLSEERLRIRPVVGLGLDRFRSWDGRVKGRFGLRYQAVFLMPERRSSFPGDNAEIRHGLDLSWSWLI